MATIQLENNGGTKKGLLYLERRFGDGRSDELADVSMVSINLDTFYKLVLQVDSDRTINAFLYDLDNTLLGSVSSANTLNATKVGAAIGGRYVSTYNDFYLFEADTDNDGKGDACEAISMPWLMLLLD